MTDPELVAKKLAFIETCVRELRDLARPEQIDHDVDDLLSFVEAIRQRPAR
jgi:hypothetical protein